MKCYKIKIDQKLQPWSERAWSCSWTWCRSLWSWSDR